MRANPGLNFDSPLVLDVLIGTAVRLGWQEDEASDGAYVEQAAQAWNAFYDRPPHRLANLVAASVRHLLQSAEKGA